MGMTVGQLQAELAKVDSAIELRIAVDGTFAPLVGVTAVAGSPFVVLRGQGKTQQSPRFTIHEEGVLGKLATLGLSDEEIGQVLGRPAQSVERKRKALGLSQKREP
jgi:hypothetical protein